jgi:hypothetical protein
MSAAGADNQTTLKNMKKTTIVAAVLWLGLGLMANAQTLLYQWAFTNVSDTATSSIPAFAITPGTGILGMDALAGTPIASGFIYFTNANSGPPGGPGGALNINGQGYNGSGSYATVTNSSLNLGTLYQFTITFWVQYGVSVASGGASANQLPREVEFGASVNYDAGGKGAGNHNGVGTALNGASSGFDTEFQDGIANGTSGALNNAITITGNPNFTGGFVCDGQTWYFEALTYDSSVNGTNFIVWIAQTNAVAQTGTILTNFGIANAQYGGINFTTNASVLLAGCTGAGRDMSSGQLADVRIYSGVVAYTNLIAIENFQPPILKTNANISAYVAAQPVSGNTFKSGARSFSVTALGYPADFSYLWRSNGVPVPGGTNATLTLTNVQLSANGASFVCSVTNVVGGTNSLPATLTVLTPVSGSYAQAIYTSQPYALWLVNEPSNALPVTIFDYVNGNDGVAVTPSGSLFLSGVSSPGYPGFPANNTSIETVQGRASQLNMSTLPAYTNSGMTICGWVYTPTTGTGGYGVIFNLPSDTANGFGLVFGGGNELDYQWGNGAATSGSGLIIPSAEWTFVALVITTNLSPTDISDSITADTNATLYIGSHSVGFNSTTYSTATTGDLIQNNNASQAPLALGRTTVSSSENGGWYATSTAQFNGVAVFYSALSAQTITNLYLTGAGLYLSGVPDVNTAGNLLLTYPLGTLQDSTNVAGPYTDTAGLPASPDSVPMTDPQHFYRLRN